MTAVVDDLWDSGVSESEQMGDVIGSHMTDGLAYGWEARDQNEEGILTGDYHLSGDHIDEIHLWNADSTDAVFWHGLLFEWAVKHEGAHVMQNYSETTANAAVARCTNPN
jgi:hypothetical protein